VGLLRDQKQVAENSLKRLNELMNQAPKVMQGLVALQRDYETALAKQRELKSKEMQAQLAQNLEAERMAERFTLIEPPVLPEFPIRPNRRKIGGLGAALSIVFGLACAFGIEFMDHGVRRTRQLRRLVGESVPLITMPYVASPGDRQRAIVKGTAV